MRNSELSGIFGVAFDRCCSDGFLYDLRRYIVYMNRYPLKFESFRLFERMRMYSVNGNDWVGYSSQFELL